MLRGKGLIETAVWAGSRKPPIGKHAATPHRIEAVRAARLSWPYGPHRAAPPAIRRGVPGPRQAARS